MRSAQQQQQQKINEKRVQKGREKVEKKAAKEAKWVKAKRRTLGRSGALGVSAALARRLSRKLL